MTNGQPGAVSAMAGQRGPEPGRVHQAFLLADVEESIASWLAHQGDRTYSS